MPIKTKQIKQTKTFTILNVWIWFSYLLVGKDIKNGYTGSWLSCLGSVGGGTQFMFYGENEVAYITVPYFIDILLLLTHKSVTNNAETSLKAWFIGNGFEWFKFSTTDTCNVGKDHWIGRDWEFHLLQHTDIIHALISSTLYVYSHGPHLILSTLISILHYINFFGNHDHLVLQSLTVLYGLTAFAQRRHLGKWVWKDQNYCIIN